MNIQEISVAAIQYGARKRPVDHGKVLEIAKSIEQQGLLQAIGVKDGSTTGQFSLVFGAHRLEAFIVLKLDTIPAYILPPNFSDEEYQLIELQENTARNDLTGVQRKAFVAEIGRLLSQINENSHALTESDKWFVELRKNSGISEPTLYRWWDAFCKETKLSLAPKQALDVHKEQFFTWLEARKQAAEEEKRRKEEEERHAQKMQEYEELTEYLNDLIERYGYESLYTEVLSVIIEAHTTEEAQHGV